MKLNLNTSLPQLKWKNKIANVNHCVMNVNLLQTKQKIIIIIKINLIYLIFQWISFCGMATQTHPVLLDFSIKIHWINSHKLSNYRITTVDSNNSLNNHFWYTNHNSTSFYCLQFTCNLLLIWSFVKIIIKHASNHNKH